MNRLPSETESAPFIACLLGVEAVQDRAARKALKAKSLARRFRAEFVSEPSPATFGLTAREAGAWGRLRAAGLSNKDAADAVKATRMDKVAR